jgi:hypothetical protein
VSSATRKFIGFDWFNALGWQEQLALELGLQLLN